MTASPNCVVSVVAPLRNNAAIVTDFLAEVDAVLRSHFRHFEVVLVDDASTDGTVATVSSTLRRYHHVRLITLSRAFGTEVAIMAGLDVAIGDFVVVISPDSDPPDLIPAMVRRCAAGPGVVFGVRTHRAGESLPVRIGASLFYWLCRRVFKLDLPSNSTHFRAFSRQAVHAIVQIKDRHRSLWVSSAYIGYGSQSLAYQPRSRTGVVAGKRFFEALELAFSVIAGNTTSPLRLAGRAALVASGMSFLSLGYIAGMWLFNNHVVAGWTTLSSLGASMFTIVLAVLAVVCEYLARLLDESRDRPLYYIREERTSPVLLDDTPHRNVLVDPPKVAARDPG